MVLILDYLGEICYRGRNIFMGYYKNCEETAKTIDSNGYLHSGDNGKLTKDGVLYITGRAKELIITAGG
jgi:long-chain-fatty-acid--CoA ligase ACSBG